MINCNSHISRDSLKLCLDAGSSKSYTGAPPWIDLSRVTGTGNSNAFPNYVSGFFEFNKTPKYIDFQIPSIGNKITVEMWCKFTGTYTNSIVFGFNTYGIYIATTGTMGFNTGNGDIYGVASSEVTPISTSWKQLVFVMNQDVSYTNNKFYINGVQKTLSFQNGNSEFSPNRSFSSGSGRISSSRASTLYGCPMQCSIFRIYNKELTVEEISGNFMATKYRYNI